MVFRDSFIAGDRRGRKFNLQLVDFASAAAGTLASWGKRRRGEETTPDETKETEVERSERKPITTTYVRKVYMQQGE